MKAFLLCTEAIKMIPSKFLEINLTANLDVSSDKASWFLNPYGATHSLHGISKLKSYTTFSYYQTKTGYIHTGQESLKYNLQDKSNPEMGFIYS